MPIPCPHFKITIVKRSQGQSAVAGAAYQSGERLFSEYDQKTKFYNKKKELVHAEIMLPSHAPPGFADRQILWNAVEAVENQWNSQLARRIVLAFPVEVPKEQYLSMIKEFCQEQFVSKGMIADFAIHDKGDGNPHAHILLTIRAMDEHGKWLPKARKVYDLDENGERIQLLSGNWKCHKENTVDWNDQKYAEVWRHSWETITNRYLEAAGRPERVDLRSFERQGIQKIPTVHLGPAAHQMEKRGIHNYFFAKAIDQVRPGGIVAFVTSRYTMDSKDSTARKHMAERADLLGAIRLPNNAFKANAGTDVVSDIIFLQKRDRPIDHEPDWVQLGKTEDGFAINQYFVDHPEMVLGQLTLESTQYGHDLTVAPIEGAVLADQLAEAVQHIEGNYTAVEIAAPDVADAEAQRKTLPADPTVKNFSYTVVDGEIYYRENSIMTQIELFDNAKGRVAGMVELRQIVNELIRQQLNDFPDEDIKASQAKLNAAYDAFTAKYGLINDKKNARLFDDDSSYYLLCSLENLDENKNLKSKADMFTKRTIRPERVVTSVDTPSEALAVSIGEHGKVDLPYMAELLGTPGNYERITTELSGVIFKDPAADADDPEAGWQTADEYS